MLVELLGPLSAEIRVADVGAAFLGETAPYQVLLDAGLGRLTAFEPDEREAAGLQARLGPGRRCFPTPWAKAASTRCTCASRAWG